MRYDSRDIDTRKMLESMRIAEEHARAHSRRRIIWEEEDNSGSMQNPSNQNGNVDNTSDSYKPITDEVKFGQNTLTKVKDDFVHAVNANVIFPKNCLQYNSAKRDIVFVGTIADLNNLKFKFSYNDSSGCGCYIWNEYKGGNGDEVAIASDKGGESGRLQLTDENLKKVSLIAAAYKNWYNYWITNHSLLFK